MTAADFREIVLPEDVTIEDFRAYLPNHNYIFTPTRELWPAASVNSRIPPVDGTKASTWLDRNRSVEQMTWAPGYPETVDGRLVSDGGWIERGGVTCYNLYRPPIIRPGDAELAKPWIDHVRRVYPGEADELITWFAHRVQRPEEKINHAIVLCGAPGVGKDTILEPVKRAIGPWNFQEATPHQMLGRFNGYLKAVMLRISEARDLGEINRYQFYDHMKTYLASPPDVLRIDEKHLREYSIFNCVGVVITTNYKTNGIYLPENDRRHFVAWTQLADTDFPRGYWNEVWGWYTSGGFEHVAAYLRTLDISRFDPKMPPRKTRAFYEITDANAAPEDNEFADAVDKLGNPTVVTLQQVAGKVGPDLAGWIRDRKNWRMIPFRMEAAGYTPVRNDRTKSGLWMVGGVRQAVYGRTEVSFREQMAAAQRLEGLMGRGPVATGREDPEIPF